MDAQVECRSDWAYAQRPLTFHWQRQRRTIQAVLAEARTPDGMQFVVRTTEHELFELSYQQLIDQWTIQPHAIKEKA